MQSDAIKNKQFEAMMQVDLGEVAIVAEKWTDEIDILSLTQDHHLQLSFLAAPVKASGGFPDHWGPNRFERMGPLFLLPAHRAIHARSNCRIQRSLHCRLNPDALSRWFDRELEWTDRRLTGSLDISSATIRLLMCRIADELRHPGFGREAIVELKLAEIGVELSRYFLGVEDSAVSGGLAAWRLRLIDDYLLHDAGSATLPGLAELCNLSVRHLARAFRISRGQSLGEYIADQRIDQARALLGSGMSIKQTAFAVGFTAPTNFAAAFRRSTGETPRQYRERWSRRGVQ